jgi:integrase
VLTDLSVKGAKPKKGEGGQLIRNEVPDGGLPGFYLIVQASGKKSWAVRYRHQRQPRKLTLGPYPRLTLAEAREKARKALVAASEGGDPAGDKRRQREALPAGDVFGVAVKRYLASVAKTNRSWQQTERYFTKDILPRWGTKRLSEIGRRDVLELLDAVEQRAPFAANGVFKAVRRLYNWGVEKGLVETSPCQGLKAPAIEQSRDRVLTDTELRWLWHACAHLGVVGSFVQMLMLTGQRRNEVAELNEAELDGNVWTIPAARSKNKRENRIVLPPAALQVLADVYRVGGGGYYFTVRGTKPLSSFTPAKASVDAAMLAQAKAEGVNSIPAWTFRDIRRSVASNMAKIGVAQHVAEALLNHKSGIIKGVSAVYNRYSYSTEKEQALAAWANALDTIVNGRASNVISLRG